MALFARLLWTLTLIALDVQVKNGRQRSMKRGVAQVAMTEGAEDEVEGGGLVVVVVAV